MRLAQERGVHRKGHNPGETKTEQELWRRTYWQLINIDIQASNNSKKVYISTNGMDALKI